MRVEGRVIGLIGLGLAVALLIIWLVGGFIPYPTADNLPTRWDHYRYIEMSRHPFEAANSLVREAPFCWRILTPLLVYLSPLDWRWSFMIVTLVGLGGAALVLYAYLGQLGYDRQAALFGLALFFSLGGLVFNLRDFYLTDPLALLAIALGFYFLNGDQQNPARPVSVGPLLIVLTVGVLAKETVAALLPLVVLSPALNRRQKLGLALLPLALLVALRLLWPSLNDYSYLGEAQDVLFHQVLGGGVISLLERVNFALLGTWGPALILILYRPRQSLAYLRVRPAQVGYLAIIYSQLLIAHNVDRLLVYGFVVVIPLLVSKARRLWIDRRLNPYGLTALTLGLQLLYFYGRPPLWSSLLVCGLLAIWLWLPWQPKNHEPGLTL